MTTIIDLIIYILFFVLGRQEKLYKRVSLIENVLTK